MSLPLVCRAVSCVFSDKSRSASDNSYQLEALPHLQRCSFSFNDVSSAFIKFDLVDNTEFLLNYQASWGRPFGAKNLLALADHNNTFGVGLDFGGQWVNLGNQNYGMNIQSDVSSARKYNTHMIFHSVVQV